MLDWSKFTPGQAKIIKTLDKPLFVAAGAGSGKTFTLTQRIVWALTPGSKTDDEAYLDSLDQVLIITFTNLAAQEIKERVRFGLRDAGLEKESLEVDNAWISTIHGMCSRMLKRHALTMGLDPEFTVLSEDQAEELLIQAKEEAIKSIKKDMRYRPLFDEFEVSDTKRGKESGFSLMGIVDSILTAAANAPHGFEDIVIEEKSISAPTMYRTLKDALLELAQFMPKSEKERVKLEGNLELIETFEAENNPGVITSEQLMEIVVQMESPNGNSYRKASAQCKEFQSLLQFIPYELSLARIASYRELLLELAQIVTNIYSQKKLEISGLDNDDLLRKAAELLDDPEVLASYANQFKLVMVDEFQDTNQQQVDMIARLSGQNAEHLCTVGDAQQSIYRFRGADVEVFEKRRETTDPDNVVNLFDNFRSNYEILRFVAAICGGDGMLPDFMDLHASRKEMNVFPQDTPRVYIEEVHGAKDIFKKGPTRELRRQILAYQIALRFKELKNKGIPARDMALLLGAMSNADIYIDALRHLDLECVVTKGSTFTDAEEVKLIEALLYALTNPEDTRRGLFPVLCSEMFMIDADDMCMLSTWINPNTGNLEKRPIDKGFMSMDFMHEEEPSKRLVRAHKIMKAAWSRVGKKNLGDVAMDVVKDSGWLYRLDQQGTSGQAKAANILKAILKVKEISDTLGLGPAQTADRFTSWLQNSKEQPAVLVGDDLDAITIMTVHGSKGLEFPVVAVAECLESNSFTSASACGFVKRNDKLSMTLTSKSVGEASVNAGKDKRDICSLNDMESYSGLIAQMEQQEEDQTLAEKIRLLYVALTRAREAVIFGAEKGISRVSELQKRVGILLDDFPLDERGNFIYGGKQSGVRRVTTASLSKDLLKTEQEVLEDYISELLPEIVGNVIKPKKEAGLVWEPEAFMLYEPEEAQPSEFAPQASHKDVFSYSSSKASDVNDDLFKQSYVVDEFADTLDEPLVVSKASGGVAVGLGSAFHELAQFMVETGSSPTDTRIEQVAKAWGCTRRQTERLQQALKLWEGSDIRAEALGYANTVAEAPFFCVVDAEQGRYLEGAIDLLCYEHEGGSALVVDYKTGDANKTLKQIQDSHARQASFYAHVLFLQGFTSVECAFVCVEVERDGQPVVVRYKFENILETHLG